VIRKSGVGTDRKELPSVSIFHRLHPEGAESLAGGVQSRAHCANGNMHDFCDFFVAQLFHLAKDQGCSKLVGKLSQELFDQDFVFYISTTIWLARIELNKFGPLEPQSIHAESNADSIKETAESSVVPEFCDLSERLQECFLSDVFGFKSVSQKVRRGAQQAVSVPLDQVANGDMVSGSNSANPLTLLRRWVYRHYRGHIPFHKITFTLHEQGRETQELKFTVPFGVLRRR